MSVSQYLAEWTKDPAAALDYGIDWSAALPTGVTISSSTWTAGTGLTASGGSINAAATQTAVRLSVGTAGIDYEVTNQVTLSSGEVDERTVLIMVRQR